MSKARRKKIFLFLRIGVVAAAIIWVASRIGGEPGQESFIKYFRQMNMWVFAGTLFVFTLGHVVVSLRWWLLLRSQSIFISFWVSVRLYFLGWFYNNFMPSSVGGDLIRAWYVTTHTEKKFEAALSVFVDRVIGLLSTLVIAAFFYSIFLRGRDVIPTGQKGEGGLAEAVVRYRGVLLWVVVIVAAAFCGLLLTKRGRTLLGKLQLRLRGISLKMIGKFKDAIVIYCSKPATILMVFLLTVLMQLMVITAFWVLGKNMGINVSLKYYYVFFTLAWVFGAIPVSIGGIGVVEGFLILLFTQFASLAVPAAEAIAYSQRVVWLIISLPGAAIHLFGAHLPKDFFVDENKPVN